MEQETWYKKRNYLHFDLPLGYQKAKVIVSNPDSVARHPFYPLIHYHISSKKVAKKEGKVFQVEPKERPISYASHLDSHIYSYYCAKLSDLYETRLDQESCRNSILAFRKLGKSNIDFAFEVFEEIKSRNSCSVIAIDISKFFDNLDHHILKQSWMKLLDQEELSPDHYAVFKSLTKFSEVNRVALYSLLGISINNPASGRRRICTPLEFRRKVRSTGLVVPNQETTKRIPQGSPISAFLSNLYMFEFDKFMFEVVEEQGGKYYRYCDDILFIVPTDWKDEIAGLVNREIQKLKLQINPKKTELRDFSFVNNRLHTDKPLQYLGFLFDGKDILIRSASLAKHSDRVGRGVKSIVRAMYKQNIKREAKGLPPLPLYRKKMYSRYSHLGRRNFIRYGLRASQKMNSNSIRKQLKPLWRRLHKQINSRVEELTKSKEFNSNKFD